MSLRKRPLPAKPAKAAAGSWLALVAATSLGPGVGTVSADVRAEGLREGAYRLVVQSYDQAEGRVPGRDAKPVGSVQRSVTADELREGVRISLVEIRPEEPSSASAPVVVAWIEAGAPDLEFDGRTARPQRGNMYGVVRRSGGQGAVQISLDRVAG